MKAKSNENSTTWLTDIKLMEILRINDHQVSELILNFDLLAYDIDGNIRHFYEEDPSELVFEVGSLKFRKKEVDEFIKNYPDIGNSEKGRPEPYLWRLQNRLKNIQYLEQIRDQQLLPPSSHLKKSVKRINDQIRDSEKEVLQNSLQEDCVNSIKRVKPEIEMIWKSIKKVGFSGYIAGAEDKWQKAALKELKNKENRFNIITKDNLLDRNLYSLSASKEKRDFVGGILQKIINPQCGKIGKDKLYDIFKKLE
jgi:hypothetical protein